MNLIVAVDQNWGIGAGNDLLYHIPEDMKFFKEMTLGKTVVCGRKTLESFPGSAPLPKRRHFVLTHGNLPESENLVCVHSLDELLERIAGIPEDDVIVIGGGKVYRELLPLCRRAYVTQILSEEKRADVFFPDLSSDSRFILEKEGEILESKNGLKYRFLTFLNKSYS